jgi:tellurite resistance protein
MPNTQILSELEVAYLRDREDELLDAVVTCAALVARADGWIDPVERGQLLDFLERNEFLSLFSSEQVHESFERRVRDLREPGGAASALGRLRRHAGQSSASLVMTVGEEVALADCRIDPREWHTLQLIRTSLGKYPSPVPSGWVSAKGKR